MTSLSRNSRHPEFEAMCVLAANRELEKQEMDKLLSHVESCGHCGDYLIDMAQISSQVLFPHVKEPRKQTLPPGMKSRFEARARMEGIPLRKVSKASSFSQAAFPFASLKMGGLAAALVFLLAMVLHPRPPLSRKSHAPTAENGAMQTSSLHKEPVAVADTDQGDYHPKLRRKPSGRLLSTAVHDARTQTVRTLDIPLLQLAGVGTDIRMREAMTTDFLKSYTRRFRFDPSAGSELRQVSFSPPGVNWYQALLASRKTGCESTDLRCESATYRFPHSWQNDADRRLF